MGCAGAPVQSETSATALHGPSAGRPDPTPWVPTPSSDGEAAPTGEITALAPGGRHSAARAAYLEFLRHALAGEEEDLVAMLAPSVGFLNRPQTIDRVELARRMRMLLDRGGTGVGVEELIDTRAIRVREIDASPDTRRPSFVAREGDLVVSAPRLATPGAAPVGPFGPLEDRSAVSLVFRHEAGRFVVVAVDP